MTILKIARDIAGEVGVHVPTTAEGIVGNNTQDGIRIFRAIVAAGESLAVKDWQALNAEALVTASLGSATQSVPDDFKAMLPMTLWNRTQSQRVKGPVREAYWQELQAGPVAGVRDTIRIKMFSGVKKLLIEPAPATGDVYSFEYRSKNWLKNSADTATTAIVDEDNASSMIDERLVRMQAKWRYLRAIGQPYVEEKASASVATNIAFAEDGGMAPIHMGTGAGLGSSFIPVLVSGGTSTTFDVPGG